MGQAKLRGTREERIGLAIAIDNLKKLAAREKDHADRLAAREKDHADRLAVHRSSKITTSALMMAAIALGASGIPTGHGSGLKPRKMDPNNRPETLEEFDRFTKGG